MSGLAEAAKRHRVPGAALAVFDGAALRLHQRWLHPPFRGLPDAPPLALEPLGSQALLVRVPPFGTKAALVFQEPDAQGRPGYVRLNGRLHRRSA